MSLKKSSRTKSLSLNDDLALKSVRPSKHSTCKKPEDTQKIMKYVDDNIIGKSVAFFGPFGRRKVVYADYTSSGRSLQFLEDYIHKEVLPAFGDCNCRSAVTGLQSNLFYNDAKDLVLSAVNATQDDEIVFCGNPAERLCYLFSNMFKRCNTNVNNNRNINNNESCDNKLVSVLQHVPILFVSTSEPIENVQRWIDAGYQVERISKNHDGFLDLVDLEKRLNEYCESRRNMIGLFSGASRLTGILADDIATTILLHQYGALSVWDYSFAASCAPITTNPLLPGAAKDAVFFHCNKLIGGVQAPGVLVIKKVLAENFGSFLNDSVSVVSAVRAGLVLQLRETLGTQAIMNRMEKVCKQILSHLRTIPEIVLIGPTCTTAKRLTTMCFLVRHPRGAFLHHRFVCAVLNDVFGIQASCEQLINGSMGIHQQLAIEYEKLLNDSEVPCESIRPGYIRVTFPFFVSESETAFILEALKMTATEAWKLLPQYEVDHKTGEWRHHSNSLAKERKWLGAIRYTDGKMLFSDRRISGPGSFPQSYSDSLQTARNIFNRARKMAQKSVSDTITLKLKLSSVENLRWFMLPGEAHELLLGHSHNVKNTVPFDPHTNTENTNLLMIHRHHSLSALDIKRFKSRSLPASPLGISRRNYSPSKNQSKSPTPECSSPPVVRFSLGGEVTCPPAFHIPQVTNLATEAQSPSRHSSCSDCTEDIQAYVKEVTKELATEIKSEIREVISKVEDVLENSDSLDISLFHSNSQSDEAKRDSICANDIVDYLREFSKEMTNEVKSEIREAVNAVDEIISPENYTGSRKNSPPDIMENKMLAKQRYSDTSHQLRPKSADTIDKHRSESLPVSAASPDNSTTSCPYTGAISKHIYLKSTSSQDSGINMCFHDADPKTRSMVHRCTDTESLSMSICEEVGKVSRSASLVRQPNAVKRSPSIEGETDSESVKWQNLPKDIWKQAAEVND